jgi:hypothetical protein
MASPFALFGGFRFGKMAVCGQNEFDFDMKGAVVVEFGRL